MRKQRPFWRCSKCDTRNYYKATVKAITFIYGISTEYCIKCNTSHEINYDTLSKETKDNIEQWKKLE